jgi:flagellar basal-body rod protein FlgG
LYSSTAESGEPIPLEITDGLMLKQGFLEGSNVDIAEELVNMIMAQRSFEVTSKAVESADETMQIVNNMKR